MTIMTNKRDKNNIIKYFDIVLSLPDDQGFDLIIVTSSVLKN